MTREQVMAWTRVNPGKPLGFTVLLPHGSRDCWGFAQVTFRRREPVGLEAVCELVANTPVRRRVDLNRLCCGDTRETRVPLSVHGAFNKIVGEVVGVVQGIGETPEWLGGSDD